MSVEGRPSPREVLIGVGTAGAVGLAVFAAGRIEGDAVRAADLQHNSDSAHTLQLEALPPWMAHDSDILSAAHPDDDEPEPLATPAPGDPYRANEIFLPVAVREAGVGGETVPTAVPPTETPDPSPSPSPSPSPKPSPTAVPPEFNPESMHIETVLTSPDGEGVDLTTGGNDDVAWLPNMSQADVIPGTGIRLEDDATGIRLRVEAQPDMPDATEGSKNLSPDSDPAIFLAGSVRRIGETDVDLGTRVLYDAEKDRWIVNMDDPCDGDEGDTAASLTDTAAQITLLTKNGASGEKHHVEIATGEGACVEILNVNPEQPLTGDQYSERHVYFSLPANTKALTIRDIERLSTNDPEELIARYPDLAYARSYIDTFGGPAVAIANGTDFWRSAEAWQLLSEGYLGGIVFDPGQAYHHNVPRLSHVDLLVRLAQQHDLELYMPSYVNSSHGAPEWISRLRNDYGDPVVNNLVKTAAREAHGTLSLRWGAAGFPGLTIGAVANPGSREEAGGARRRRSHLDYDPYEAHWSTGATSHVTDIMRRVLKANPDRLVSLEQHGIILGTNVNLIRNGRRAISEVSSDIAPEQTMLVLPIFNYSDPELPEKEVPDRIKADLGSYPLEYGRVLMPIYRDPDASFDASVNVSAAAISAQQLNPSLRVALPGIWGDVNVTDVLRSSTFSEAAYAAVAAIGTR